MFPEFYRPTEDEFRQIWKKCVFALDANVLLNLYRYSDSTANSLLGLFGLLKERMWLPHQAALEFQKNRCGIIDEQMRYYDGAISSLKEGSETISNDLEKAYGRHRFLQIGDYTKRLRKWCGRVEREIAGKKEKHAISFDHDSIRDSIDSLFTGRVGEPYDDGRLKEIEGQGKKRYAEKTPPGYEDSGKEGRGKYGDLVLWYQVMDKAREIKKPVVLVTDERKEDWWQRAKGKTVGPRPELIAEMLTMSGQKFYMYSQQQFIEYARDYVKAAKNAIMDEALAEVGEVQRSDAARNYQFRLPAAYAEAMAALKRARMGEVKRVLDAVAKQPTLLDLDLRGLFELPDGAADIIRIRLQEYLSKRAALLNKPFGGLDLDAISRAQKHLQATGGLLDESVPLQEDEEEEESTDKDS